MNRNSLGVVPVEALPAASRPDPEVVARPQRRRYTAEYKGRILREAEAAAAIRGGIGALLRREGLYSSLFCVAIRPRRGVGSEIIGRITRNEAG